MSENNSSNRVGAGANKPVGQQSSTSSMANQQQYTSGMFDEITRRLTGVNINVRNVNLTPTEVFDRFSTAQKSAIYSQLKKMGISVSKTTNGLKTALSDPNLNITSYISYEDLASQLMAQYIPAVDTTVANIPTRSITQYNDEVIGKIVDNVWQSKAGALPTPEERAAQIAMVQGKFAQGTLTTSKKVYNKKTKQYENVTTSTPSYSQEQAKIDIENQLKKSNPDAYNTTKALGFTDLITSTMRGGI